MPPFHDNGRGIDVLAASVKQRLRTAIADGTTPLAIGGAMRHGTGRLRAPHFRR